MWLSQMTTEEEQVCRSPNKVPKNVEQEGRGNTNHHRCHWNSREGHSKLPPKDTRQA